MPAARVDLDDELGALGAQQVLSIADRRPVMVAAGARLKVTRAPEPAASASGRPRSYVALAPGGASVEVAASEVEGPAPRFEILPGMRGLLRHLDPKLLAWALVAFGPGIFLMAVRWQVLLRVSQIRIRFFTIVRLHYMGLFFNMFMPGGLGGDVIKAVYVAGQSARKAEAATMVLVDRVMGLAGLLLMASAVVLFDYGHLGGIAPEVGTILLLLMVGTGLFFSNRFRRLVRYEWLLGRLPRSDVFKRIDAAAYQLRGRQKGVATALALTIVLQFVEVFGVFLAGRALGIRKATLRHYLAFVPIAYLCNAIPISFGGIGLMEGAFLKLFRDAGVATASQGFMLGVVARLLVVAWSLPGVLSILWPPAREAASTTQVAETGSRAP